MKVVKRGDPAAGRFVVFQLNGDRILCVEAVNAPPEFMSGKQLIQRRAPVDATKRADPGAPTKTVATELRQGAHPLKPAPSPPEPWRLNGRYDL